MAKKKTNPITHQDEAQPMESTQTVRLETLSKELKSLKTLNEMLLKQTVERREEVKTLLRSKRDLELEIDRLKEDKSVESELKKSVVMEFVSEEMKEKLDEARNEIRKIREERDRVLVEKSEIQQVIEDLRREMRDVKQEKVQQEEEIEKLNALLEAVNAELVRERGNVEGVLIENNEMKKSLDVKGEEIEKLKMQVVELEKCNSATEEELARVRAERRRLMEEKKESEKQLELVVKDKVLVEESLEESSKLVADLKRSIMCVAKEKVELEQECARRVVEIADLQREVEQLGKIILSYQEKEKDMIGEVSVLKEHSAEAMKKQEQLGLELGKMLVEKNEIEMKFEFVMEEKSKALESLEESVGQLEAEKRKVDEIIREKAEVERVRNEQDVVIGDLREQLNSLKAHVLTLMESTEKQVEMISVVQLEAKQYKDDLDSVTLERDNARDELSSKEKAEERLRSQVLQLEKRMGENQQELERVRVQHSQLFEENEKVKNCVSLLTEEKRASEKKLMKAEEDIEHLQAKMSLSQKYLDQALQMLKNMVGKLEDAGIEGNGEPTIDAEKMVQEIQPFEAALETIRKAFENKKGKDEDLNRQCESLKLSVEAHKKKNFWAWFTSATSLIAAVSMAYVARVH